MSPSAAGQPGAGPPPLDRAPSTTRGQRVAPEATEAAASDASRSGAESAPAPLRSAPRRTDHPASGITHRQQPFDQEETQNRRQNHRPEIARTPMTQRLRIRSA